jgi:hypothetical protein
MTDLLKVINSFKIYKECSMEQSIYPIFSPTINCTSKIPLFKPFKDMQILAILQNLSLKY